MSEKMKRILLGITGASGAIYAKRLAEELQSKNCEVELLLSEAGEQVVKYEKQGALLKMGFVQHNNENYFAPPASGTSKYDAMVILPCSMGTMGRIATGATDNLLTRAADVFLKEKRSLLIVPRESPHNRMQLENQLKLHDAGAIIVPASPFFYYHPETIDDLVNTVVGKVLDQLKIDHTLFKPWG